VGSSAAAVIWARRRRPPAATSRGTSGSRVSRVTRPG
jgi:hypothetical protein